MERPLRVQTGACRSLETREGLSLMKSGHTHEKGGLGEMGPSGCLKVLLVEDNPEHARLVQTYLDRSGQVSFGLLHADTLAAGLERLNSGGVDVVLLDLTLPDSAGLETFRAVQVRANGVPVVILSGIDDEDLAVQAVREGAQDYLIKGEANNQTLLHALHFAIERKKRQAEAT
jgi:DNA-binding response OmpR family regulator